MRAMSSSARALLVLTLLVGPVLAQDDPAKALKSKVFDERLAAVEAIAQAGGEEAEALLLRALKDDDWEIVERAATALGEHGTPKKSLKTLVSLAHEGPVRRVRTAAAEALARIDAEAAFEELLKKSAGKTGVGACGAVAIVARAVEGEHKRSAALWKALKSKESVLREAAARALPVATNVERADLLTGLLAHEDLGVRAAALEGIALRPEAGDLDFLLAKLDEPRLDDVLERRARAAVVALVAATEAGERGALLDRLTDGAGAGRARSAMRVLAELFTKDLALDVLERMDPLLAHESEGVRAMGARALATVGVDSRRGRDGGSGDEGGADGADAPGPEESLERLYALGDDASARVRLAAVLGVRRAGDPGDDECFAWLAARAKDGDARVREEAVTSLGAKGLEAAPAQLVPRLADDEWGVAVCAAVSLGKTMLPGVVKPLADLYGSASDWRVRGGAVVGLGRCNQKEAVPTLIEALADSEPVVARTAYEYLLTIARRRLERDVGTWQAWWAENGSKVKMVDPDELAERRKKYGYVKSTSELYEGLDVIVLESRGDHLQNVLGELEIDHRLTQPAQVMQSEVHPEGVFVSNCTGEIEGRDVERLQWFVRCGGYLFGSCWALEYTIARVYPGVVQRLPTTNEVLDNVRAVVCSPGNPYLEGVFDGDVVPIYALQGAYLIDVVQPERVEVLIDSPECAARWGGGNMSAWFTVGHGTILDSVNHFDVQGLELATHLKKPEERQAYAVDHMGLTYAELREIAGEKFWKSTQNAARAVRDLSVFRLVSNFVRAKRVSGD